jgi:hypothetical protein
MKDAIGLSRLMGQCEASLPPSFKAYERYAQAEACRPEYETSWLGEMDEFENSANEAASTTFGDLPLWVISQDPDRPKPGWPVESIFRCSCIAAQMGIAAMSANPAGQRLLRNTG